jgi:hypothetical protein
MSVIRVTTQAFLAITTNQFAMMLDSNPSGESSEEFLVVNFYCALSEDL